MVRFFVDADELTKEQVLLTGENAAHAKVLRLKNGEEVVLCDGQGNECVCTVEDALQLRVQTRRASVTEPGIIARVYIAMPKADKLEHVIQKATELGAYEIVTFPSARCISRPDEKSLNKKLERWQKIAASAAEQCGRGRIPKVTVLGSYADALASAADSDIAIVFYENEHAVTLHDALCQSQYNSISLLTGPEGGFEVSEIEQAAAAGLRVCTLGSRILRCETAPLCALSAVMYDAGEF